ncbi:MAG: glycosyltransferase [Acidobacteriota bacterium]
MTTPPPLPITFVLPGEPDLEALAARSPDADPRAFRLGEHAWVLQTYSRLARAGHTVSLSATLPASGVALFHTKHRRAIARLAPAFGGPLLISIRADGSESGIADFEILQNGRFADGRRRFPVPFWRQPGLVPRDGSREARIERCAFKGVSRNLHPRFRSQAWRDILASRGIAWEIDAADLGPGGAGDADPAWCDYSAVDLVLAVRPASRRLHSNKPASKLVNAWTAGVPALLGPEFAYRELRRSSLDYLEVDSIDHAREAVDLLRSDTGLYRAMVENGRHRAAAFSDEAVLDRWVKLLYEVIPARVAAHEGAALRKLPLGIRSGVRRLHRWLTLRPSR